MREKKQFARKLTAVLERIEVNLILPGLGLIGAVPFVAALAGAGGPKGALDGALNGSNIPKDRAKNS